MPAAVASLTVHEWELLGVKQIGHRAKIRQRCQGTEPMTEQELKTG